MVKSRVFFIALIFIILTGSMFADIPGNKFFTVKLYGGWNSWVIESVDPFDYLKGAFPGGYSFGMDFLMGSLAGLQYGIETSYLSIFIQSYEGFSGTVGLIPVTADLVINEGIFYTDLGLGVAFPVITDNLRSVFYQSGYYEYLKKTNPTLGFLAKIGCGINYPITDFMGFDAGITMFLTFSNFGMRLRYYNDNLLANIFYYGQYNLRAGVNFYF